MEQIPESRMRSFFTELKRRNVYKVAISYAVVAWLLVQIATQVFPFFDIPNWAVRMVVLFLVIGFPIALIFAWAFELTPEGIKRDDSVPVHSTSGTLPRRTWLYLVIAAAVLSVALLFFGRFLFRQPSATAQSLLNSVAVLPFDNMSSDKENAYFASGIQDEILTRLAAVDGLKVISRASTEKYRSHPEDLRKVASELGVTTLLEGSVQKSGEKAHINVQLIDAATDSHIWAQAFDRDLKNIFAVEGEVAEQVATALKVKLVRAASAKLTARPTSNPEAYDSYLRGLYAHIEWFRGAGDPDEAIRYMREAVARDPNFVSARARLAIYLAQKYAEGLDASPEDMKEAKARADEAIALDNSAPDALMAKGIVAMRLDGDYKSALAFAKRARDMEPSSESGWFMLSLAEGHIGNWENAIQAAQHAVELDPRNAHMLDTLAFYYALRRQPHKALETIDRALSIEPQNWTVAMRKAEFLLNSGQLDAATEVLKTIPAHVSKTSDPDLERLRWRLALYRRDYSAALSVAQNMPENGMARFVGQKELLIARSHALLGQTEEAATTFAKGRDKVRVALASFDKESHLHQRLARILAGLADQQGALAEIEKAIGLTVLGKGAKASASEQDPTSETFLVKAELLAQFGRRNEALDILEEIAGNEASGLIITASTLTLEPMWDSLRNEPRFEKLLRDLTKKTDG